MVRTMKTNAIGLFILLACYFGPTLVQSDSDYCGYVTPGGDVTHASFRNISPVQALLYYIDEFGDAVLHVKIAPGSSYTATTSVGQPWIATDCEDNRMNLNYHDIIFAMSPCEIASPAHKGKKNSTCPPVVVITEI